MSYRFCGVAECAGVVLTTQVEFVQGFVPRSPFCGSDTSCEVTLAYVPSGARTAKHGGGRKQRSVGISISKTWEGYSRDGNDVERRDGQLVKEFTHLSSEECVVEDTSQVFSTGLNGSANWPCNVERVMRVKKWETKILRMTFRPDVKVGEGWVDYRKREWYSGSSSSSGGDDWKSQEQEDIKRLRVQVELLSKQQGMGKSSEEPGELARRGSGLEEGCKMESDEETDF